MGGYEIVEEVVNLGVGAFTSQLVRKYKVRSPDEQPLLASPHRD